MDRYKKILELHNCKFISQNGSRIVWENPKGKQFCDDMAVISLMPESAWAFWCNEE